MNQSQQVSCLASDELCTWFQIAFLPVLEYNDYEFVVVLLDSQTASAEQVWDSVNFRIVFVNKDWTEAQFIVRAVFSIVSLIVCLVYSSRICSIKRTFKP